MTVLPLPVSMLPLASYVKLVVTEPPEVEQTACGRVQPVPV